MFGPYKNTNNINNNNNNTVNVIHSFSLQNRLLCCILYSHFSFLVVQNRKLPQTFKQKACNTKSAIKTKRQKLRLQHLTNKMFI